MTDELSIQQQRPSAAPYVIGGAAVGGAAGAWGLPRIDAVKNFVTEPAKYASYEAIIDEAEDEFVKKLNAAEGDEKTLMETAKDIRAKAVKAGEDWDKDFEAFKAEKGSGLPELDANHDLMKQKADLEKQIADLKAKTPTDANVEKTVTKELDSLSAVRKTTRKLCDAQEKVNTLKAEKASEEVIKKAQQEVKDIQKRLDGIYDDIVKGTEFKNIQQQLIDPKTGEVIGNAVQKEQFEAAKKQLRKDLEGYAQEYMQKYDKYSAKRPANAYTTAKANIANEEKAIKNALDKLKEVSGGHNIEARYNAGNKTFDKAITTQKTIQKRKLAEFKKLQKNFNKANQSTGTTFWERLQWLISGEELKSKDKAVEEFFKTLTPQEKKLLGENVTAETFEKLIKGSEENIKAIDDAVKNINTSKNKIADLKNTISRFQESVEYFFGKGAYVDEKGIVCRNGKPLPNQTPKLEMPKFNSKNKIPQKINVTYGTKATEVDSGLLKETQSKLDDVIKNITAERKKLAPNAENLTDDAIKKLFETDKGTRKDAIAKVVNESKDDVKKLFEGSKKWGKYAAVIGGTALAGILVASLFRPSAKNQA